MTPAAGPTPAARAAGRVLLAVTSTALAAGIMAGTAGAATASVTRPAASTPTRVIAPSTSCTVEEWMYNHCGLDNP